MISIHKKNSRYRAYKKRDDLKKFRNKLKRKTYKYNKENKYRGVDIPPYKVFYVPEIFSIVENPEDTIIFFNEMIEIIEKIRKNNRIVNSKNLKYSFLIKMDTVNKITGDALMYLLTIINNTRGIKSLPVNWVGNFPKNKEMQSFLKKSGFLDYMKTDKKNLMRTNDKIQIRTGKTYVYDKNQDIDIRQEVVDFTVEKLGSTVSKVNFIFNMLTELIPNIEHAYSMEFIFEPTWYIFVENEENKIKYTFIDNGIGIPTTVKKSYFEIFKEALNWEKEYKYIETAVNGVFKRSMTGQIERSTGLPDIYDKYKSGKVQNMVIISNKAYFTEDTPRDLNNNLTGTLFYWEIKKEGEKINDN